MMPNKSGAANSRPRCRFVAFNLLIRFQCRPRPLSAAAADLRRVRDSGERVIYFAGRACVLFSRSTTAASAARIDGADEFYF